MQNSSGSSPRDMAVADAARRLTSVFADVFNLPRERIHPDLRPGDVARWDSIGHVTLVVAIEEEFSIQCEVDEIMDFTSFQAILSAIERRLPAGASDEVPTGKRIA